MATKHEVHPTHIAAWNREAVGVGAFNEKCIVS